ncbi:hypothetical protein [Bacteroides ovatus]|uniref:hypothetical protein n=1 Tax=Bacteroides ovatus TaxID=28116 RepID=UPI001E3A2369|nr:hypothetical protein [Bacteroides ovatus]
MSSPPTPESNRCLQMRLAMVCSYGIRHVERSGEAYPKKMPWSPQPGSPCAMSGDCWLISVETLSISPQMVFSAPHLC